jgi:hypothetical protein
MTRQRTTTTSRRALTQFARILLTLGSGESPWLIVAFVLGVTALSVFSNLVFSLSANWGSLTWAAALRVLLAVMVIVGLAYGAYRYDLRSAWQPHTIQASFDEKSIAAAHAGLVWLLSPGSLELPLFALRHHMGGMLGERLQHCWLLISPDAQDTYERLALRVQELRYEVQLHPIPLMEVNIEATYRAVESVYSIEAQEAGLKETQIIADLTGGLKPMTAGMVLACLPYGRALEYIESDRDATGHPLERSQRAIRVGVDFAAS